jgi:SulP family sulfate permease
VDAGFSGQETASVLLETPATNVTASEALDKPNDILEKAPGPRGQKSALGGVVSDVLDATFSSIPIALVGVGLAYANLPSSYLSMGILATLLCLGLVHCVSAGTGRPMAFSARLFEATTLAAILASFSKLMPSWGLAGTPEQLLALLCLVSCLAAVVCALLYLVRADRFTRMIPAPVYAGFSISIAILLFMSQFGNLLTLWRQGSPVPSLLVISSISIGTALLLRRFRPRLPSTALAIAAGGMAALVLQWSGMGSVVMIASAGQALALPFQAADFSSLMEPSVNRMLIVSSLISNGLLLGLMLFINMTVSNEIVSQMDDRYANRWQQALVCMAGALGGGAGSAPIASSTSAAMAAVRNGPMSGRKCLAIGGLCWGIALSGLLNSVALAAVAAAMLVEAFHMADRASIRQTWGWLRGAELERSQKEDLYLVALVTVTAVLFNVATAVFMGLLLGLILFAVRNAKKPVRYVWTGAQLHSNCARGRGDLALLGQHGEKIHIVELGGELFFGSVSSLDASLMDSLQGADSVILDWSRVPHVDSSVAMALSRWQRKASSQSVKVLHAGAGMLVGNVPAFLTQHFPNAQRYPDLDRALEAAESAIIGKFAKEGSHQTTQLADALTIFRGLSDKDRSKLEAAMPQRLFKSGDCIFNTGEVSDHMLVVLHGSASVFIQDDNGREVRISTVRRGGVLGEIGFLDQAPRSAQVKAQEDVMVAVLTREVFSQLREQEPRIVSQVLTNLTLDLAARLRHTSKLALARNAAA